MGDLRRKIIQSFLKWPAVNIDRITQEFDFQSINLLDKLEGLVDEYKNILLKEDKV